MHYCVRACVFVCLSKDNSRNVRVKHTGQSLGRPLLVAGVVSEFNFST